MTKQTTLDYIRHGLPEGGSCYRGNSIDDPLSNIGFEQMWKAVEGYSEWDQIVSSPMIRCLSFAQALADKLSIPVSIEKDLREVGFGHWEGKTRAQLQQENEQEYIDFYRDPVTCRPQGAESLDVFGQRVANVYEQLLTTFPHQKILVVAHAGVIRATAGHVLSAPAISWYRMGISNAAISRFTHSDERSHLFCHNVTTMDGLA